MCDNAGPITTVIKMGVLKPLVDGVVKPNLPYTVSGRSIAIDGQIWRSGDNFLEFHDNPSVTLSATVEKIELRTNTGTQPHWTMVLQVDVSGTARLKKMIAHIGSHNSVSLKKDDVTIEARLTLLPVDGAWLRATMDVLSPPYVPVTAETSIWGIDIGHPFRIPVPVGQVADLTAKTIVDFDFLGEQFQVSPRRAWLDGQEAYCVSSELRSKSLDGRRAEN